jgi:hypothetical protein
MFILTVQTLFLPRKPAIQFTMAAYPSIYYSTSHCHAVYEALSNSKKQGAGPIEEFLPNKQQALTSANSSHVTFHTLFFPSHERHQIAIKLSRHFFVHIFAVGYSLLL